MITKIEFENLKFKKNFTRDEIKSLSSQIRINQISANYFVFNSNGKIFEVTLDYDDSGNLILGYKGKIYFVEISKSLTGNNINSNQTVPKENYVKSPMPGLISKIKVSIGDSVKKGDGLLTIEAMKMENEIKSPVSGIVEDIKIREGSVVEKNAILVILKSQH